MPTDCTSIILLCELLLVSVALIQIDYMSTAYMTHLVQILKQYTTGKYIRFFCNLWRQLL